MTEARSVTQSPHSGPQIDPMTEEARSGGPDPLAIITGGASGLGRAVGALLRGRNTRVVLVDIDTTRGEAAAQDIGAHFMGGDVQSRADWARIRERVTAEHGSPTLLSFNAGVMTRPSTAALDDDPFTWIAKGGYDRVFGVNVHGVAYGLEALLPITADGGAIVVTVSIAGITPTPFDPFYAASKHAAIGLVRSVAPLLKPRAIRLNAFCPGPIDTGLMPTAFVAQTRDAMQPADAAQSVAMLLEHAGSGQTWVRMGREEPATRFRFADLPS